MRTLAMAFVLVALVAVPALAVDPVPFDEIFTGVPGSGGGVRTNDCPGTIIWDTGMFDEFTPPTGCATAGSSQCFINAQNDGGFPADGRRMADDFEVQQTTAITHVKFWGRFNAQGYADQVHPVGFCVKFYAQDYANLWCPDGTQPGELAIGALAYDEYVPQGSFIEYEITTGLPRNFNYCVTLPTPFVAQPGFVYWVSISADYDFVLGSDGAAYTQWFERMYEGAFDPYCEASWWDNWSVPEVPWNAISIAINQPCWTGWNIGFVLYSNEQPPEPGACCVGVECLFVLETECATLGGDWYGGPCQPNPCPPIPTDEKSWGQIKNQYR